MKIGIIDADLLGRQKHRFPNLACEKISGYWKEKGAEVHLLLDYFFSQDFDQIYISKVFTDTEVPAFPVDDFRIQIGGTGFFLMRRLICQMKLNIICLIMTFTMIGSRERLRRPKKKRQNGERNLIVRPI